jgi:mono/diheme cytochrome c family protein
MMRHSIILGLCSFLFFFGSCRNNEKPEPAETAKVDSLSPSFEDSIRTASAWSKFSYGERKGKRVFDEYCVICHGQHGEGDGFNSYNLDPKPHSLADSVYIAAFSDAALAQVISFGGRGVNKSVLMPAYKWTLRSDQISYLVAYVRLLAHNAGGGPSSGSPNGH